MNCIMYLHDKNINTQFWLFLIFACLHKIKKFSFSFCSSLNHDFMIHTKQASVVRMYFSPTVLFDKLMILTMNTTERDSLLLFFQSIFFHQFAFHQSGKFYFVFMSCVLRVNARVRASKQWFLYCTKQQLRQRMESPFERQCWMKVCWGWLCGELWKKLFLVKNHIRKKIGWSRK